MRVYQPIRIYADTQLRVSYEKNPWKDGDLRPQHYFACENTDENIKYNQKIT